MGIDAKIIVRNVPASIVTDEWLTEISWNICNSIGAEHFFVRDGLREPEYSVASKAWNQAFDRHFLNAEWKIGGPNKQMLYQIILGDVGPSPTQRRLAIDRTLTRYRQNNGPPPGSAYHQDGDSILAAPGECLLELSLVGRYYGEYYERGDIVAYCAMAEWLELHIPGCLIWYGGDSSGVLAELFTQQRRMELRKHLYSASGRKYFDHRGIGMREIGTPQPKPCSLCPGGLYCGAQCMWGDGGQAAGFHCRGCGKSIETRDRGKTWVEPKERF